MNPITNPYSPGAGSFPPELVGRDSVLEEARILLGRVARGRAEKSMLLTGLRGVGKTVLLNRIEHLAREASYHTVFIEAHEDKSLALLLAPSLRKVLYDLDALAGAGDKVRRGWAVLRSFVGALKITVNDVTFGLDIEPARGAADSGDLEIDLPALFVALAEAAQERGSAIALFIDEIQYFNAKELGALIMAMHKVQQRQLPLVLLGAGLPVLPGLAGDSKSYAERLFSFPDIGALSGEDAAKALADPAREHDVLFEVPALDEIYRLTKGYPYFLQEWGYQAWNRATASPITQHIIEDATSLVTARLDQSFFRVRYDRLTSGEKKFLRAMATLGSDPQRSGDIAEQLGVKLNSIGPTRATLIKKGMIYSPTYGHIAFTVPLFDEFMRRAMPQIEP